ELERSLHQVAAGGSALDPQLVEALVVRKERAAGSPLGMLTPREREVLEQMAQGKNNATIAKTLVLTERAVQKHINSVFSKLGLGGPGIEQLQHRGDTPVGVGAVAEAQVRRGRGPAGTLTGPP